MDASYQELTERVNRLRAAVERLKFERNDQGPRLMKCANADCRNLTRCGICALCQLNSSQQK
jgi:hypothetical protein